MAFFFLTGLGTGLLLTIFFAAQIYGGTTNGTIVMDTRPAVTTYTVSNKLDHVDANKLVSSMSNLKQAIFGSLIANADVGFTTSASDATQLAKTLNGKLNLNLLNGKIGGIDLLNQLAAIGKFAGYNKAAEPFTNVAKLTGDFDVKSGVATTNNLQAAIDGGTMSAAGSVNLVDQSINMAVTAVLSAQMAQQVGGTSIGGYLTTALANSKGELVMPVLITGTFASPKVQPDVQKIAKMKLENLLPTGSNPGGLTTSILGGILGQKGQQQQTTDQQQPNQQGTQQQQPQQAPANPMQSILDKLAGKKTQQPPAQQTTPESDKLPDPSKPKTNQPQQQQQQQQQVEDKLPDPSKPKI